MDQTTDRRGGGDRRRAPAERVDGRRGIEPPDFPAGKRLEQAAAILTVGAAAVSLVAGVGTYLYLRFTQDTRRTPTDGESGTSAP